MKFSMKCTCLVVFLGLIGCAANKANPPTLFTDPESLDGQLASACGFLHYKFENVNFYPSRRHVKKGEVGVGVHPGDVSDDQLRANHKRSVCLTGHVQYAGCTVTHICTGSNFVYQIVVDDINVR